MKLFLAGDYYPKNRIISKIKNEDYSFFDEVKPLIAKHDFSILNLETPIVINKYANPINKCGPNLKAPINTINSLKYAGFNMVSLANNHIMDYGKEGLDDTIKLLNENKIEFVGAGNNLEEASQIKYFEKDGKKLAIINCCENEFSIAEEDKAGANPLNPIAQFHSIVEAKQNADFVLVIVHGGHEHWLLPSPRMVETYRFFVEVGADAVVNHHQHCYSGYEIYQGKPIFYGLGNFCFDNEKMPKFWKEGYAVSIDFNDKISFSIHPYIQCDKEPIIHFLNKNSYSENINHINKIIIKPEKLKRETEKYYNSNHKHIQSLFQPYNNRLLQKLYLWGLLPNLFNGKRFLFVKNYILCESHRDKLSNFFNNKNE